MTSILGLMINKEETASQHCIVNSARLAMIGCPSKFFHMKALDKFSIPTRKIVFDSDSHSLAPTQMLKEMAHSGSLVILMQEIIASIRSVRSEKNVALSLCLVSNISKLLEGLCEDIMELNGCESLIRLRRQSRRYVEKIIFLSSICRSLFLNEGSVSYVRQIEKCFEWHAFCNLAMRDITKTIFITATKQLFHSISSWSFCGITLGSSISSSLIKHESDLVLRCLRSIQGDDYDDIESLKSNLPSFLHPFSKNIYRCGCILSILRASDGELYHRCIAESDISSTGVSGIGATLSLAWSRKAIALYSKNLHTVRTYQLRCIREYISAKLSNQKNYQFDDSSMKLNETHLSAENLEQVLVQEGSNTEVVSDSENSFDRTDEVDEVIDNYNKSTSQCSILLVQHTEEIPSSDHANHSLYDAAEGVLHQRYESLTEAAEYRTRFTNWKIDRLDRNDIARDELCLLQNSDAQKFEQMKQERNISRFRNDSLNASKQVKEMSTSSSLSDSSVKNNDPTTVLSDAREVDGYEIKISSMSHVDGNLIKHEGDVKKQKDPDIILQELDFIDVKGDNENIKYDQVSLDEEGCASIGKPSYSLPQTQQQDSLTSISSQDLDVCSLHEISSQKYFAETEIFSDMYSNSESNNAYASDTLLPVQLDSNLNSIRSENTFFISPFEVLLDFCSANASTINQTNDDELPLDYVVQKCIGNQISLQLDHIQHIASIYFLGGTDLIQHLDFLRKIMLGKGLYIRQFARHVGSNVDNDTAYVNWKSVANVMR